MFCSETYRIEYQSSTPDGCRILQAEIGGFSATLLNSPSGSGKTTLLRELYFAVRGTHPATDAIPVISRLKRLVRRTKQQERVPLTFDFHPNLQNIDIAAAYIPQSPPFVNHWRMSSILPDEPKFLSVFFPDQEEFSKLNKRRLGELSGGQKRKLYACSALERLVAFPKSLSFVLFDETFDGLGLAEASSCLLQLRSTWSSSTTNQTALVLIVSHLDFSDLMQSKAVDHAIGLSVQSNTSTELSVRLEPRA